MHSGFLTLRLRSHTTLPNNCSWLCQDFCSNVMACAGTFGGRGHLRLCCGLLSDIRSIYMCMYTYAHVYTNLVDACASIIEAQTYSLFMMLVTVTLRAKEGVLLSLA